MRLPHLVSRCFGTPLAIVPEKAEIILSAVILPKLRGETLEPLAAAVGARDATPAALLGQIAVIPIHGTLVRRTAGVDAMSGLQSYDDVRAMVRSAVADPAVSGILLDVDSPGGEVAGLADLADEILAARDSKPVFAVANDMAASAAYWLASSAERIYATQTASVGSIGVIAVHLDQSGADARDGLVYTPIFAGAHKADFTSHAPLSADARARAQAEVDQTYALFTEAVGKRRPRLGAAGAKATEASLYTGQAAVDAGLADRVGTLDTAAADLAARIAASARPGGARGPQALAASTLKELSMIEDALTGAPEQGVEAPRAVETAPAVAAEAVATEAVATEAVATEAPAIAEAVAATPEAEPAIPAPVAETPAVPAAAVAAIEAAPAPVATVDLAALRKESEAAQARTAEIVEIVELCGIAGFPHLAGEMIASGKNVATVGRDLLARKADASDARPVNGLHGGPAAQEAMRANNYGWGAVVAQAAPSRPAAKATR